MYGCLQTILNPFILRIQRLMNSLHFAGIFCLFGWCSHASMRISSIYHRSEVLQSTSEYSISFSFSMSKWCFGVDMAEESVRSIVSCIGDFISFSTLWTTDYRYLAMSEWNRFSERFAHSITAVDRCVCVNFHSPNNNDNLWTCVCGFSVGFMEFDKMLTNRRKSVEIPNPNLFAILNSWEANKMLANRKLKIGNHDGAVNIGDDDVDADNDERCG